MLATLTIDGRQRRVVMQANKNGFFYVLDREKGALISAHPITPINWANGIDSNGRPIENAEIRQLKDAKIVMPSPEGAHNWHPMSFSPTTGLVYLGVLNDTAVHAVTSDFKINLHDQTTGADRSYQGPVREQWLKMVSTGRLVAWHTVAQHEAWHADLPDPKSGGTLTTPRQPGFPGQQNGQLPAFR